MPRLLPRTIDFKGPERPCYHDELQQFLPDLFCKAACSAILLS
jgi:hypothetical protein